MGSTPPEWQNHDISTLKLLQIVHRHGERTVLKDSMPTTDPFKTGQIYWAEGFGQLTNAGKYRMYKMGQYLRKSYDKYLKDENSPLEVYVRSSAEHRCIESVSCLLSGMYPPKNHWQWNNESDTDSVLGKYWQPFPIETFIPEADDTLLVPDKKCPKADEEHSIAIYSDSVKKFLSDFHSENISKTIENLFNESIDSLYRGQQFWDTLKIESERNLIWPQLNSTDHQFINISQNEIIKKLEDFSVWSYVNDWNRDFIRRIRIGKLIETIITNMKNIIENKNSDNNYKLYVYSTHDSIVVPLLQALLLYNNLRPSYGSAVIIELHQSKPNQTDSYFVRIYYFNETLTNQPFFLNETKFSDFESINNKWFYEDFDELCGLKSQQNIILSEMTFMVIGIGIGVALLGLSLLVIKFIKARQMKSSFHLQK